MKNKDNNSSLLILTGIIAGASAVYFLKSDKGQQMLDLLITKGDELKNTVSEQSQALVESGKSLVNDAYQLGTEKATDLKDTVESTLHDAKDVSKNKIDNFQSGVDRAKSKLANA